MPRKVVKDRISLRRLELRGLAIVAKGGQIGRVNDRCFLVKSQSSDLHYAVKWIENKWVCDCPYYIEQKRSCKHIHAVNFVLKLPQIMMSNLEALESACPSCGSNEIIRKGFRHNKSGFVRRYHCKRCSTSFKNPVSYENISSNISLIVIAIDLFYKKLSLREIKNHLWQIYGIDKSASTIHNWIIRFTRLVIRATNHVKFRVGKRWLGDEMVVRVNGKKMHLWNVLDYETRYQIASLLVQRRGSNEASQVINAAIERMGFKPDEFVTDGLSSYRAPLMERQISHVGNVGIAQKENNNRIERFHGTVRSFVRAKRGMKNRAPELLEGHKVYYDLIRPHISLDGHSPQGHRDKRWLALISATKACTTLEQTNAVSS
jgi:transposase-like protein